MPKEQKGRSLERRAGTLDPDQVLRKAAPRDDDMRPSEWVAFTRWGRRGVTDAR